MLEPHVRFTRNPAGLSIAYSSLGKGPPDLLWVPNFTSHVDAWWLFARGARRWVEAMARLGRLIHFDQPGTGASDPIAPDALPTMEQWMDDVRVVLDAEGVDQATLVAEDAGGPVAILFAATHPDRVRNLIVINSYARMERADDYPWGFPPEVRAQAVERWSAIWGTGAQLQLTAPSYAADTELRRIIGFIERSSAAPGIARALFDMISAIDVRDVLPSVQAPTLVMHRRGDPWIHIDHGRYLAENIPGATFIELDGDDHYAYVFGDTEQVAEHIAAFVTGAPGDARDAQRILSTVLLTDIVESTRLAAEAGDAAWRGTLDRHDALARELIASHQGRIIKSTGDGVLATFDGPARGVRCAKALAAELAANGLPIRAGLHTGEIELRGDDIGGIAVHVASRVLAFAERDQVLVSQTVKDLTIGSGLTFEEHGEHELKGVPGTWRLYAAP